MLRRLSYVLLVALATPPVSALADGGSSPPVQLGGDGVLSADGAVRYVTIPAGSNTLLTAVRARDGHVMRWRELAGGWGIPAVTYNGTSGGLARNNRVLVLAEASYAPGLRTSTTFEIVDPKTFGYETITLHGDVAYDALSPSGDRLYLIQHTSRENLNRYVVRAYDLRADRVLPGRIADRTQRAWVMQGAPVARATSDDQRFVYTLYQNYGGYPFVHALDTVRGVAHCIGLPWTGDQSLLGAMKLSLADNARTLSLEVPRNLPKRPRALPSFRIDTHTYRLLSSNRRGFPWWAFSLTALALPAGVALRRSVHARSAARAEPDVGRHAKVTAAATSRAGESVSPAPPSPQGRREVPAR